MEALDSVRVKVTEPLAFSSIVHPVSVRFPLSVSWLGIRFARTVLSAETGTKRVAQRRITIAKHSDKCFKVDVFFIFLFLYIKFLDRIIREFLYNHKF